ncbi:antigen WC1.1-like [Anas platyrhynchos]|uniref:antigen WC1.1-like n=1 Tax=Anas platyrhynchos TaxID=8839 RepID=UPI003AF29198
MEDVGVVCLGEWCCTSPKCGSGSAASPLIAGVLPAAGSRRVRLVDGAGRCAGRVEIYYQGRWGTVCDNAWDLADAAVVCHQLGCGGALEAAGSARFGEGSGQIWLDGVNCSGAEAALWDCPAEAWGQHDCGHKEDAGVVCSEFMALRLENSDGCSGRLQVFYNGTWGSVCSNSMTTETVSLVCKELGCGNEGELETDSNSAKLSGITWLDHVECGKSNSSFWQCPSHPWHLQSCDDLREEAHITCNGSRRVRLVDGAGRCAGRVEIYYQGRWGTVCDNAWDLADAAVVCHQLGCGGALEAAGSARFGEGSGQIWLDGVNCSGAEAALWDCPAEAWGQHDCGHKEDAGVVCSEFMALRLENSDGCSGRLQVFYNGTWGSVCSNSMTTETVSLVCKELGCGNEGELETDSNSAKLSGITWLDHVECGKSNSSFWQCPSHPWHLQSCDDLREEAHITCNGKSGFSRHQVHFPTGYGEMQRRNPEGL